ncbi:MAG TPA: hypothetical protein VJB56_01265 [Candidatus Paceibacterota bacterium]|uniref:Uncharacterized protein n=1 Tax=Candidatus Giovannonibacteria bacterium RIFCSPLOWO2_01_FULL_46_32 TaxID=1798353 RepID=A0A1F5XFE9_9BACT|nr:MAG: hypothetical protein A3B19_00545 [Candidatus Giovannonibacteria bacterium RIFCSPLOWO2_01_FULL_46_32]
MFAVIHPDRWLFWAITICCAVALLLWGAITRFSIEQDTQIFEMAWQVETSLHAWQSASNIPALKPPTNTIIHKGNLVENSLPMFFPGIDFSKAEVISSAETVPFPAIHNDGHVVYRSSSLNDAISLTGKTYTFIDNLDKNYLGKHGWDTAALYKGFELIAENSDSICGGTYGYIKIVNNTLVAVTFDIQGTYCGGMDDDTFVPNNNAHDFVFVSDPVDLSDVPSLLPR